MSESGAGLILLLFIFTLGSWAVWAIVGHITGRAQRDFMQRRHRKHIDRLREGD